MEIRENFNYRDKNIDSETNIKSDLNKINQIIII